MYTDVSSFGVAINYHGPLINNRVVLYNSSVQRMRIFKYTLTDILNKSCAHDQLFRAVSAISVFRVLHLAFAMPWQHRQNSRVVMWVQSTQDTLPTCVVAVTWVDATCVVQNSGSMWAYSTRLCRVANGIHFQTRFFFYGNDTTVKISVLL